MSDLVVNLDWSKYHDVVQKGAVHFLLGRKTRLKDGSIVGGTVSLLDDTADVLREIAKNALARIEGMKPIDFDPYAHPELGEEYFVVSQGSDDVDEASPIVDVVLNVKKQPDLGVEGISGFVPQFYCIVLTGDDGVVGLVRKSNPKQVVRSGRRFFRFADSLVPVKAPSLILDEEVDLVITGDHISVIRPHSFEVLAREISFSEDRLSKYVDSVFGALEGVVNLGDEERQLLLKTGSAKVSYVKRLRVLGQHLESFSLDSDVYNKAIEKHNLSPALRVSDDGNVELSAENLGQFLDLLEGRFFRRDFTNEECRADRLRVR